MKILLVEDNEANRYLVTYLLEQAGHKVVQGIHRSCRPRLCPG